MCQLIAIAGFSIAPALHELKYMRMNSASNTATAAHFRNAFFRSLLKKETVAGTFLMKPNRATNTGIPNMIRIVLARWLLSPRSSEIRPEKEYSMSTVAKTEMSIARPKRYFMPPHENGLWNEPREQ